MLHSFCLITARDYCEVSVVAWLLIRMTSYFGGNYDCLKDFYMMFQPRIQSLLLKSEFQLCVFLPCKVS